MRNMVTTGEVNALKPDRVWQETEKALAESHPEVYFEVLRDCNALTVVFPGDRSSLRRTPTGQVASGKSTPASIR